MSAWTYDPATGQVDEPGGTVVQPGAISWQPYGLLIAAAPDLLRACTAAMLALRGYEYANVEAGLAREVADVCAAAIARVEGR